MAVQFSHKPGRWGGKKNDNGSVKKQKNVHGWNEATLATPFNWYFCWYCQYKRRHHWNQRYLSVVRSVCYFHGFHSNFPTFSFFEIWTLLKKLILIDWCRVWFDWGWIEVGFDGWKLCECLVGRLSSRPSPPGRFSSFPFKFSNNSFFWNMNFVEEINSYRLVLNLMEMRLDLSLIWWLIIQWFDCASVFLAVYRDDCLLRAVFHLSLTNFRIFQFFEKWTLLKRLFLIIWH